MTRPKVDPDKRRRTAQACESCKRRKQKCNGADPCNTCIKRSLSCSYGVDNVNKEDEPSPPKQQKTSHPSGSSPFQPIKVSPKEQKITVPELPLESEQVSTPDESQPSPVTNQKLKQKPRPRSIDLSTIPSQRFRSALQARNGSQESLAGLQAPVARTSGSLSTASEGADEEAVLYNSTRMLQDPTGRLLYVGDSATLSFLQLIRMIVDNVVGPTPFTSDPRRHRIVEGTSFLPTNFRRTHLLPDRQTAQVLVDSYFLNTTGFVEVFDRPSFLRNVDLCYADPLNVDPSWLCLLHLTFAIGLVMASPPPRSRDETVIQKLRAEEFDRAEIFYQDAKNLSDPMTGFEDAGFWSIQALTLMSVYTVAVSKRNAAYAYHGMAIRSAFALGLHREETMCIYSSAEQSVRRNLWRSLFVLDRFLSVSLGRPTAIRESDCSGKSLAPERLPFPTAADDSINSVGLEASVRSCHAIGVILDEIYSKRKISTQVAQDIANICKEWPAHLDRRLHWMQGEKAGPQEGIVILHVNLLYCHSIVLLCRPFFLFLMNKRLGQIKDGCRPQRFSAKMEKFTEACVQASNHSIALVWNALEGRYLPQRNPFVMYYLFSSALVVLSNEFAGLYHNPTAETGIDKSIGIMQYCAEQDPQASRLLFILTSFRDVVDSEQVDDTMSPIIPQSSYVDLGGARDDPINSIFTDIAPASPEIASILSHPFIINTPAGLSYPLPSIHSPEMQHLHAEHSSSSRPSYDHNHIESSPQSHYDRARAQSQSNDYHNHNNSGNSSTDSESHTANDAEIDFQMLWQWPNSNAPVMTPGVLAGIGFTPGGSIGLVSNHGLAFSPADIQGVSDSSVPLYGVSHGGGGV